VREHLDAQARRHDATESAQRNLQAGVEELRAVRDLLQQRSDAIEATQQTMQVELESLRDRRTVAVEGRLDSLESSARGADADLARLRDQVIPAVAARGDVLLERLAVELDEWLTGRRMLLRPLPAPSTAEQERLSGVGAVATLLLRPRQRESATVWTTTCAPSRAGPGARPRRQRRRLLLCTNGVEGDRGGRDRPGADACGGLNVVQVTCSPSSSNRRRVVGCGDRLPPARRLSQQCCPLSPGSSRHGRAGCTSRCEPAHRASGGEPLLADPTTAAAAAGTLEPFWRRAALRVETELLHPFPAEQQPMTPSRCRPNRRKVLSKAELDRLLTAGPAPRQAGTSPSEPTRRRTHGGPALEVG
jgi:hypothetical protein